jgi:hypothetical protein
MHVERHPMFSQILEALVRGDSAYEIHKWARPKIAESTLTRYRNTKLAPAVQAQAAAPMAMAQALQARGLLPDNEEVAEVVAATSAVLAGADPLLQRIEKHQDIMDQALKDPEVKLGAKMDVIRTDLKGIELFAKLTGRLDKDVKPGVKIQIVNPQPSSKVNIMVPVVDIQT